MCCWPYVNVELDDPPKPKKKKEEKPKEYVLASSAFNVEPVSKILHLADDFCQLENSSLLQEMAASYNFNFHGGDNLEPRRQGNHARRNPPAPSYPQRQSPSGPWRMPARSGTRHAEPSNHQSPIHSGPWQMPARAQTRASGPWRDPADNTRSNTGPWSMPQSPAQPTGSANADIFEQAGFPSPEKVLSQIYSTLPMPYQYGNHTWTGAAAQESTGMQYPGQPQLYRSTIAAPGPDQVYAHRSNEGANGIWAIGASQPLQRVPQNPTGDDLYWCKDLDATWHKRTTNDIYRNCLPGDWLLHPETKWPYFVRKAAA